MAFFLASASSNVLQLILNSSSNLSSIPNAFTNPFFAISLDQK
jgi:hypothetical protein